MAKNKANKKCTAIEKGNFNKIKPSSRATAVAVAARQHLALSTLYGEDPAAAALLSSDRFESFP